MKSMLIAKHKVVKIINSSNDLRLQDFSTSAEIADQRIEVKNNETNHTIIFFEK